MTSLGISLVVGPMQALGQWVLEHGNDLLTARDTAIQHLRHHGG
ncbi:hypothetical protein [Nocardia sp. NPDC004604]